MTEPNAWLEHNPSHVENGMAMLEERLMVRIRQLDKRIEHIYNKLEKMERGGLK